MKSQPRATTQKGRLSAGVFPDKSGEIIKTHLLLFSNNNSCLFYEIAYNNCAYQELRSRECKNAIATLQVVSALL